MNTSTLPTRLALATRSLAVALAVALTVVPGMSTAADVTPQATTRVIVRAVPGLLAEAGALVQDLGGTLGRPLGIIGGFVAEIPAGQLPTLERAASTAAVTADVTVTMSGRKVKDGGDPLPDPGVDATCENGLLPWFDGTDWCAAEDPYSMSSVLKVVKAKNVSKWGFYGQSVDVALIDTGVTPVEGLLPDSRIIYGPDLSFDADDPDFTNIDGYGHGTHLAGIIAGRDPEVVAGLELESGDEHFVGVAPRSRIVSVKVGDRNGVADVSQVIAAIDWVVAHRRAGDLNIKVLNLAFSSNSTQDYRLDPLTFAVEAAWNRGIVVVTAAGNHGGGQVGLPTPARDPFVIAVGATDANGTHSVLDDSIPSWSQHSDGVRGPDVVAPGTSIPSLIPPDSVAAQSSPGSLVADDRLLRGSGTSQAAAVVSGVVALLVDMYPDATPDQIKRALMESATPIPDVGAEQQGAGIVDIAAAAKTNWLKRNRRTVQSHDEATGLGSLEAARGDAHVMDADGTVLTGEVDVRGIDWDGSSWSGSSWSGSSWSGSSWSGSSWSSGAWLGSSWSGSSWSGSSWSGSSWSGSSWSGSSWSGSSWSGSSWSGSSWS